MRSATPIRGLTPPACLVLVLTVLTGMAQAQSSRIPSEDVLRPLLVPATGVPAQVVESQPAAPSDEPPRSKIALRRPSTPEKIDWQLDDPVPASAKKPRLPPKPGVATRTAGHRYPVRQAGGQEPLELQPAGDAFQEPTPLDTVEGEVIEEYPSPPVPSRPRSFTSIYQPKKANGPKADAAPDFKCPSREELMKPICELTVDIAPSKGDVPKECPLFADAWEPRMWCDSLYTWKASSLCHKPLYFEHMSLERYGHTWHPFFQPVVSGAHFFGTIPILPYKMGVEDPHECIYALGYYRPGNCAPKLLYPLPLSIRGAVYEAAAITGLVFLIP